MDLKDKEYLIRVTEYDGLDYDWIEFTQNDTNNCRLNVEMFEPVDQLVIIIDKNDNTQVVDTLTYVEGNKYTYDMPISTINVIGTHKGYLAAYGHDNDRRTLGTFKYKVKAEPSVEQIATDTEYPILTQLISSTSALNEEITVKEIERSDYYSEVVEDENTRISNEETRVTEFDGIKKDFDDLKKVTIDSNVAVNLQNQINVTNTSLETKASKNEIFSMANMGQDIKTAMTGGSVAVVGKNTVLTENIVTNQVTPLTTNFFDLVNFLDLGSVIFTKQYIDNTGRVLSATNSTSIIFKVAPNTKYILELNGVTVDRGNVVGSIDNIFTNGTTKELLGVGVYNVTNKTITFTTGSTTNYVMVYFVATGETLEYYNVAKQYFKLYNNIIPSDKNDKIKKTALPIDLLYSGEVAPKDTNFFVNYELINDYRLIQAYCDTNGIVNLNSSSSQTLIINNVTPLTKYYIKIPLLSDRMYVLSSNNGSFNNGQTYPKISTTIEGAKIYSFTTLADTTSIFVYYSSAQINATISDFTMSNSIVTLGKGSKLKPEYLDVTNNFIGKKILTLGDSITAINENEVSIWDRSWRKYFKEVFNPSLLSNVAVPGATWRDKIGTIYDGNPVSGGVDNNVNNVIGNQIEKIKRGKDITHPNYVYNSEYSEYDIIIIACGTNDLEYIVPTEAEIETQFHNGTIPISNLSLLDRKSWAGAMRYAVDNLRSLYPNAKIYICTPIQRTGFKYEPIVRKNTIIKEVCKRLSVNIVDSFMCGVYDMTCPTLGAEGDFNDGLHLSIQGAKKLGYFIANEVKNKYY